MMLVSRMPCASRMIQTDSSHQIDHRHPDVREDLFKWGAWILDVGLDVKFYLKGTLHLAKSRPQGHLVFGLTRSSI